MTKTTAALACLLASALAHAGAADVHFVDPQHYQDAGFTQVEIGRTTEALDRHLQQLARTLPDGQTLKVDVLDVDLAGWLRWNAPREIRVVTGGADYPRIKLRYTLEADGRAVASGEETISDMDYTWRFDSRRAADEAYGYELRMLDRWFASRFIR